MISAPSLIEDIVALPPVKKAEIAEHVERLKEAVVDPTKQEHRHHRAGSLPGVFVMMPDFDDPLGEFEEYV